jgi:predicted aspartyl protease
MKYLPGIGGMVCCLTLAPASFGACTITKIAELTVSDAGSQPVIEGRINGQSVRMLVNTGAPVTSISEAEAKRLGLKLEGAGRLRLYGMSGQIPVAATRIESLQFGTFTGTGARVAVTGTPKSKQASDPDFILGEDLLSRFATEFDFAHRMIRLLRPDGCQPEQLVYWAKSYSMADLNSPSLDYVHIATTVVLNGIKVDAFLVTGMTTSLATTFTARQAGVTNADHASAELSTLIGDDGLPINTWVGTFSSFSIGDDETVRNVKLRVGDLFVKDTKATTGSRISKTIEGLPSMIVGYDFFLAHRIVVLFKERKLLFTYNGGPIFQAAPSERQATN